MGGAAKKGARRGKRPRKGSPMKASALMKFRRLIKSRATFETSTSQRSVWKPASSRADEELVEFEEPEANLKVQKSKRPA